MATRRFIGAAPRIAQVDTATVGGTIEVGDLFLLTIGNKTVTVSAESTDAQDVAEQIADEWAALDPDAYPEFAEITAQANAVDVLFVANTPGKPFTLSVTTTESGGGAADAQTFTSSTTTANSGPNVVGLADNWSGDTLPVNGDTIVIDSDSPAMLWDLEALASVVATEVQLIGREDVGLSEIDDAGYPQYRPRFLSLQAASWLVESQSGLMLIDVGTATASSLLVKQTGPRRLSHRAALSVKGSNAGNTAYILRGDVAFSQAAGETSQWPVVRLGYVNNVDGDAQVYAGASCTLGALVQNGGRMESWAAIASGFTLRAGEHIHQLGGLTSPDVQGGTLRYNATATLAGSPKVSGSGHIDFGQDPRNKTVTNPIDVYGDKARVSDPNNVVNSGGSFVVDLNETASLGNIVIGAHRRATFGTPA